MFVITDFIAIVRNDKAVQFLTFKILNRLQKELLYDPTIQFLGIYLKQSVDN